MFFETTRTKFWATGHESFDASYGNIVRLFLSVSQPLGNLYDESEGENISRSPFIALFTLSTSFVTVLLTHILRLFCQTIEALGRLDRKKSPFLQEICGFWPHFLTVEASVPLTCSLSVLPNPTGMSCHRKNLTYLPFLQVFWVFWPHLLAVEATDPRLCQYLWHVICLFCQKEDHPGRKNHLSCKKCEVFWLHLLAVEALDLWPYLWKVFCVC